MSQVQTWSGHEKEVREMKVQTNKHMPVRYMAAGLLLTVVGLWILGGSMGSYDGYSTGSVWGVLLGGLMAAFGLLLANIGAMAQGVKIGLMAEHDEHVEDKIGAMK